MTRGLVGDTLPLLMKPKELRAALGLGPTKFWELRKAGELGDLQAPIAGYYSGAKVQKWLEGQPLEEPPRRSFGKASRGGGQR